MKVTWMPLSRIFFWLFIVNTFFHFFSRGIRMHILFLIGDENGRISRQKTVIFCWKSIFFENYFPRWRSLGCHLLLLYSPFLSWIRSFSVLKLWHMYAHLHPNRGSKWMQKSLKNCLILIKHLKLNFQDEGHLVATFLIFFWLFIVNLFFHFFSRGIRMHILFLIGVQNGRIIHQKEVIFC